MMISCNIWWSYKKNSSELLYKFDDNVNILLKILLKHQIILTFHGK